MIYKTTLEMGGKSYNGKGETIYDALSDIPLSWEQIKGKGVIKVSQGKQEAEKLFYLKPLKRIFANKIFRQIWAKNLQVLLNNNATAL